MIILLILFLVFIIFFKYATEVARQELKEKNLKQEFNVESLLLQIQKLEQLNAILLPAVEYYANIYDWEKPVETQDQDFFADKSLNEHNRLKYDY